MNRCDEQRTGILPYLDNALTAQELEDFRAHLPDCSNCSERLEEERALGPSCGKHCCILHPRRFAPV